MTAQNPLMRRYLFEFGQGLRGLSQAEQRELCMEIESHIYEAMQAGRPVEEVLRRLGPADRLARAYAADALLSGPGNRALPLFEGWRRRLTAFGILAGTSLTTVMLVPLLGVVGYSFLAVGPIVMVLSAISFAVPSLINLPPGVVLPDALVSTLLILFGLLVTGIGWGARQLLLRYLGFLTRTLKGTLPEGIALPRLMRSEG